jgi:hypothetical protein
MISCVRREVLKLEVRQRPKLLFDSRFRGRLREEENGERSLIDLIG